MHYSMIVAAKNYDDLTQRLAPFRLNDDGRCPREYMVFFDVELVYRLGWKNVTMRRVVRGDELLPLWDDQLAGWCIEGDEVKQGDLSFPVVDVPVNKIYASVEAWLEADGNTRDPETGKYGYWDNPNGRWIDWTVGGRWSGLLDGYDPTTNPVNFTPCDVCGGSGDRPGWVNYAATVPAPDGSLNVFRGPKRERVVLAAAEYIAVPVNPVQMFHNAVRRKPRRLVADPFDPEAVLQGANVTVDRCFTDVLAEWSNGCDGCKGSGRIHAPFNAPHPGDSMIAPDVDWSAIKDRQAAEAAQRWDAFKRTKANRNQPSARMDAGRLFTFMDIGDWIETHGDDRAGYIARWREEAPVFAFLDRVGAWHSTDCSLQEVFDARFWSFVDMIPPDWVVYVLDIYTQ